MQTPQYHKIDLSEFTFLITGGAGFIGSNLVGYLLNNNAKKVRVLDNLATGFMKNLEPFQNNPRFEFMEGDIRDLETCKKAMEGIDYVSHQAALGSVPRSINDLKVGKTPECAHCRTSSGSIASRPINNT